MFFTNVFHAAGYGESPKSAGLPLVEDFNPPKLHNPKFLRKTPEFTGPEVQFRPGESTQSAAGWRRNSCVAADFV